MSYNTITITGKLACDPHFMDEDQKTIYTVKFEENSQDFYLDFLSQKEKDDFLQTCHKGDIIYLSGYFYLFKHNQKAITIITVKHYFSLASTGSKDHKVLGFVDGVSEF